MDIKKVSMLLLTPLCLMAGGALNVIGTYNQRHIVGIESSRALTYANTPYGQMSEGVNFIDSKVTRSYTAPAFNAEGKSKYKVDGVVYSCDYPLGYRFRYVIKPDVPMRAKMTKEGNYTSCTLIF